MPLTVEVTLRFSLRTQCKRCSTGAYNTGHCRVGTRALANIQKQKLEKWLLIQLWMVILKPKIT